MSMAASTPAIDLFLVLSWTVRFLFVSLLRVGFVASGAEFVMVASSVSAVVAEVLVVVVFEEDEVEEGVEDGVPLGEDGAVPYCTL